MRVITFANLKGGSAKTTSALAIAAGLSQWGRVLVVDVDPQGTATQSLGETPLPSASEMLSGFHTRTPENAVGTTRHGIDLVAGDRSLDALRNHDAVEASGHFASFLAAIEEVYDFVIVDTPPQPAFLVVTAMAASDDVYVPVVAGRAAVDGLYDLEDLASHYGIPGPTGAFATRIDIRTRHDLEAKDWLRTSVAYAFQTFIRETVLVRESENDRTPLPFYSPASTASHDYAALTDEIISRIQTHEQEASVQT